MKRREREESIQLQHGFPLQAFSSPQRHIFSVSVLVNNWAGRVLEQDCKNSTAISMFPSYLKTLKTVRTAAVRGHMHRTNERKVLDVCKKEGEGAREDLGGDTVRVVRQIKWDY